MGRAGAPSKLRAKHAAYDPEAMQKLWKVSVERTGVDYAVLAGASTPSAQPTAH
jgi:hypothetical protein